MNIQEILRRRRAMKAQAQQRIEEKKRKDKIHSVPMVALIIANILVLSLDVRVVDAIYKLTNNWMLAVFALFTTGAMFVLWFDILYQYLLANTWQTRIAIAFSALSLVSAGFFAFLDYGLSAGFGATEILPMEVNLLFAGMVILTIANGIGLLWWYMIDDQVKRKGIVEKQRADSDFDEETLSEASKMLAKAGDVLLAKETLEKRFGKAAVNEMLEMLAGIEVALGIDIDGDGTIGKPQKPIQQYGSETASPTSAGERKN